MKKQLAALTANPCRITNQVLRTMMIDCLQTQERKLAQLTQDAQQYHQAGGSGDKSEAKRIHQ